MSWRTGRTGAAWRFARSRKLNEQQFSTDADVGADESRVPAVDVTVVVPAFNESGRLPSSLPDLIAALRSAPWSSEVVVVDDGSTDGTARIAEDLLAALPHVRVITLPWNCGKGTAVRVGVSVARGAKLVFVDADMASDIASLPDLVRLLDTADIAVGSRVAEGATVAGRSLARGAAAATYRRLVLELTSSDVGDTQCGFKAFNTPTAKLLFSMTTSEGFGFDVEVLSLAKALGLRVAQCPVRWTAVDGSHVSLRKHAPGMLRDLHRARRHQQRARAFAAVPEPERLRSVPTVDAGLAPARVIYLDPPGSKARPVPAVR